MTGSIFGVNNECRLQTLFLSVSLTQVIYLLNTSAPVSGDGQYSYSFPQLPPWPPSRPLMTLSWRERRYCSQSSTDLACARSLSAISHWSSLVSPLLKSQFQTKFHLRRFWSLSKYQNSSAFNFFWQIHSEFPFKPQLAQECPFPLTQLYLHFSSPLCLTHFSLFAASFSLSPLLSYPVFSNNSLSPQIIKSLAPTSICHLKLPQLLGLRVLFLFSTFFLF